MPPRHRITYLQMSIVQGRSRQGQRLRIAGMRRPSNVSRHNSSHPVQSSAIRGRPALTLCPPSHELGTLPDPGY